MKNTITIENGVTVINTHNASGSKNTSGHVGVCFQSQKWIARIQIEKKSFCLGRFEDFEDAVAVRKEAEKHRDNGTFHEWFSTLR